MKIISNVLDAMKLISSWVSAFFSLKKNKKGGITISNNSNIEVSGNVISGKEVTIESNENAKVRDNTWT